MYCKLFASLYQGTLRGRSNEILVFTNLLAHCDREGFVDKHWKAIADETGIDIEEVKAAIVNLELPDIESRSPEHDGARLVKMDGHRAWGWRVVNYSKYRAIKDEDDRREQNRRAQAAWRVKNGELRSSGEVSTHKLTSADVITSKQHKPESAHVEGEGEALHETAIPREFPDESQVKEFARTIGIAEWKALDWFNEMESCGWLDYQKRPVLKWKPLLTRIKSKWVADGRPSGPPSSKSARRTEADRDRERTGLDENIQLKEISWRT